MRNPVQATQYRLPAGIVLVTVASMAWLSSRMLAHRPALDPWSAPRCVERPTTPVEDARALADTFREGSRLGAMDGPVAPREPASRAIAAAGVGRCAGALRLVATTTAPARSERASGGSRARAVRGLALIALDGSPPALVRVGARVGSRTLVALGARDAVLADADGGRCLLPMSAEPAGLGSLARPTEQEARGGGRAAAAGPAPSRQSWPRGALRSALGRVRVVPHVEQGRTVGVRLLGVRTSPALEALGLRDGDVLRAVNGYSVATPDDALRAYGALRDAPRLTVSLERSGTPWTLELNVR